jgi:D-glycerate 3-kinase
VVHSFIEKLIETEGLPSSFRETVEDWYLPLARSIAEEKRKAKPNATWVLGVQGTQGSGKSTLALFLKEILEHEFELTAETLSLDDFYLTRAERIDLAENTHPLFETRGVPGTHDVGLAIRTIQSLCDFKSGERVSIPRFDKACDDRHAASAWTQVDQPSDIVILEGWCIGCPAEADEALHSPINTLEEIEDTQSTWRSYANTKLATEYQELFSLLDKLVVLQAPSFECVLNWRTLQEEKLKKKSATSKQTDRTLDNSALIRFIQHYERLTRHCLKVLPSKANWVLHINSSHEIQSLTHNN